MNTLRVNTLQDALGTGHPTMPGAAKAWVNFNGTSITDNGTGDYMVNFTTAMPDANYSTVATSIPTSNGSNWSMGSVIPSGAYSTTGVGVCHLITGDGYGGYQDTPIFNVAIFR